MEQTSTATIPLDQADAIIDAVTKPPPPSDPRRVTFSSAVNVLALLALGDREKSTQGERHAWADAVIGVLLSVSSYLGTGTGESLLDALDARKAKEAARGAMWLAYVDACAEFYKAEGAWMRALALGSPSDDVEALGRAANAASERVTAAKIALIQAGEVVHHG